jgi:hypothetical protein
VGNTFKYLKAKNEILRMFSQGVDPAKEYHKHSEQFYLETLNAIRDSIPFRKSKQNLSLKLFLYAGCLRFERWFAPSPYVVSPNLNSHFELFLNAFIEVEGKGTDNAATFQLHAVRNDFYANFDERLVDQIPHQQLDEFLDQLKKIPVPKHPIKHREYNEELDKVLAIIEGIRDRTLKTVLKTRLPYVLHLSPLRLNFNWRGISMKVNINPIFRTSGETVVNISPAVQPIGASRWQAGISEIEIECSSLIDCDLFSKSLQACESHDPPIQGWPKCFTLVFKVLYDLAWRLRIEHGGQQQWIPAPRDIADVSIALKSGTDKNIDTKIKTSPAHHMYGFTPTNETLELDLYELKPFPWHVKCRSLSTMYLELGETNEALFWLNVAVETLFNERFLKISEDTNHPELGIELNSPKAFWEPAEEIISKQFPEMAGKVQWPETEVHVSIYAKIKYLYKNIEMKTNVKELLKQYRNISKYRNELLHGVFEDRIHVDLVKKAIASFDWIDANMMPADGTSKNKN